MKKLRHILFLIIIILILSSCSKEISQNAYNDLITSLEKVDFNIIAEDVEEDILQGQRKWLTINGNENISVYLYESSERMEEDASYIDEGGTSYNNGKNATEISWVSLPHFFKKDNMIVLYVGEDSEVIQVLEQLIGPQFAGATHYSIENEPITMQHNFPIPLGVDPNLSDEQITATFEYWKYSDDWSITMPGKKEDGSVWNIGIGPSREFNQEIPYRLIDKNIVQAEDLAAITFAAVERWYYDGLSIVILTGFRGDEPNEPEFGAIQYISTIQPDIETSRGITIGDSIEKLKEVYPEVEKSEGYWSENNEEKGIPTHDSCYIYATKDSNRSIMFLTENNKIVQIDMGDGLDGQYRTPSSPGFYK